MRPTYRPHRLKRVRKIGFRARMETRGGRAVINARRRKGRKRLVNVQPEPGITSRSLRL